MPISEQEQARRRESNASVIGTSAMEGVVLDPEILALMECFAKGELTRTELSAGIDVHIALLLQETRPLLEIGMRPLRKHGACPVWPSCEERF